jgi:hypothetical protein
MHYERSVHVKSRLALLCWDSLFVILVDIIQTLMCLGRLKQRLRETGRSTPAARANTGCSRTVRAPANEGCIVAGVERETLKG